MRLTGSLTHRLLADDAEKRLVCGIVVDHLPLTMRRGSINQLQAQLLHPRAEEHLVYQFSFSSSITNAAVKQCTGRAMRNPMRDEIFENCLRLGSVLQSQR